MKTVHSQIIIVFLATSLLIGVSSCAKKPDDLNRPRVFVTFDGQRIKPETLGLTSKEINETLLASGLTLELVRKGDQTEIMHSYECAVSNIMERHSDKFDDYMKRTGKIIIRIE